MADWTPRLMISVTGHRSAPVVFAPWCFELTFWMLCVSFERPISHIAQSSFLSQSVVLDSLWRRANRCDSCADRETPTSTLQTRTQGIWPKWQGIRRIPCQNSLWFQIPCLEFLAAISHVHSLPEARNLPKIPASQGIRPKNTLPAFAARNLHQRPPPSSNDSNSLA